MAKLTIEVSGRRTLKSNSGSIPENRRAKSTCRASAGGKAPRAMVEKMYGVGIFYEDAANALIPEAYSKAVDESGLDIASQPSIDVVQLESGKPFVFTAEAA